MRITFLSAKVWPRTTSLIVLALLTGSSVGQSVSLAALSDRSLDFDLLAPASVSPGAMTASPVVANILPEAPSHRKFWDRENRALFVTVAALSAADFAVTRANLKNGGRELNPVTRLFSGSTAGLAFNFAGETAGIIGLSYYFHKAGHHRLERITPLLNIGASSFAVAYDLSHR
jgi:hypothetical protein